MFRFEGRMFRTKLRLCQRCHQCRLNLSVTDSGNYCSKCYGAGNQLTEEYMLPIWYDDNGIIQYHVPEELNCLTIGEQLLIQRVSPYVPIIHIKNGTLGIKGHVCSFTQDIRGIAESLPRLPQDVKAVRLIRHYQSKSGEPKTRAYVINKHRVLRALHWLVKYHEDYRKAYELGDLEIDSTNFEWMGDSTEADLLSVVEIERECDEEEDSISDKDRGPAEDQCMFPIENDNDEYECSGVMMKEHTTLTSEADDAILHSLKNVHQKSNNKPIPQMDWPQHGSEPLSEYSDIKLFTNAFPWLFPGGIGDYRESSRKHDVQAGTWAKQLLYYDDGRFSKDPIWSFFALNYIQRHRNQSSGGYFVKSFISNAPKSLKELQDQIQDGDDGFIKKITYFSQKVRGSDAFWRLKRSELYTWISHHIECGNGAPSLFMTLSCAEYFWPDLIRLLEERIWISNGMKTDEAGRHVYDNGKVIDLLSNKNARNRAVNDYSIVVQEFFQNRAKDFLQSIGRDLFKIKHYWVRYEFAKGRGQIHAHLLAITDNSDDNNIAKAVYNLREDKQAQADLLAEWASNQFGMTAIHPASDHENKLIRNQVRQPEGTALKTTEPCSQRLCEISDFNIDSINLVNVTQMHNCSEYCLRHKKGKKSKKR